MYSTLQKIKRSMLHLTNDEIIYIKNLKFKFAALCAARAPCANICACVEIFPISVFFRLRSYRLASD